jgi:aromatic-L-amino-acid decarboxylase
MVEDLRHSLAASADGSVNPMNLDEFRTHGHHLVDWMADYLQTIGERRPVPDVLPGTIRQQLPEAAPAAGEPFDRILADFERIILPGMAHWQHPGWFAYFPANSSPPSVLAEMLTATLAAQCMSWQTSPAATELEQAMMEWLRDLLGIPEGFTGVIQDTASTATLTAVLTARDLAWERAGREAKLTLYASAEAHSSVVKAARLAGFADDLVRRLPADAAYAMVPAALEQAIRSDIAAGLTPACVVATVGTTSSTGVDPVAAIGRISRAHGLFLHVDAAWAGTAALLPEMRWIWDGLELADSVVTNPHKWMLVNFDCSAYYVRDVDALLRTCRTTPEYLRTAHDAEVVNYRDWGIPLGRRFRALKLWFVLRSYGAAGLQAVVREHIRLGRLFADWVDGAPGFERMAPAPLGLVCFRHRPGGMTDGPELDRHNRDLLGRVNAGGRVFLTHTTLGGQYVIRMAIGQRTSAERHVREAWEAIASAIPPRP